MKIWLIRIIFGAGLLVLEAGAVSANHDRIPMVEVPNGWLSAYGSQDGTRPRKRPRSLQNQAQNIRRSTPPGEVRPERRRHHDPGLSHQGARDALNAGQIRPLQEVLHAVRKRFPGRTLDVDLRQRGGQWIYQIKLLTPEGNVLSVAVDARSNRILGVKGRGASGARHR